MLVADQGDGSDMFSQTMLALVVALALYGLYRLCRSSVANARGVAPPASPSWSRLLLQPHVMDDPSDRPPTEHATERLQQAAHQGLRDDIARSPLDTLARRRLMNELDAWRQRPGDALSRPTGLSSLAGIRERFEHAVESLSSTPDEDPATNAEPPPRVLALRPALKRRESELETLGQRLDALQVPVARTMARTGEAHGIADPFDRVPGKDDLRAIRGIGKRMQRLLNGMGVTTFAQLAAFRRSHIERVAAELHDSQDDIEAEDWVGQARALLARRRRTHEEG